MKVHYGARLPETLNRRCDSDGYTSDGRFRARARVWGRESYFLRGRRCQGRRTRWSGTAVAWAREVAMR
jgi:hypothetical protein